MKKERKVWAMTLIAFWLLAPKQLHAQQDSLRTTTLKEVVITATKFPKNQTETGKVLTVIDEAQLQRSQGKDLSQLLNEQVSLIVNGANSNPGKDKSVYLRGAGSQYTLILLDGIPVNDPSGVGGVFDPRLLPIDQIERIEILKGSQSTLYGTDALAGVINIITKQKGSDPFGGLGTITYGSYNTFKGSAGINGSTKVLDYQVSLARNQTDGISEAKDTTGTANFDKDGFSQNAVQVNFGLKPSDRISLKPFFRYADFDGKYDAGAFADDPVATYKSDLVNVGLNGQVLIDKGAITLLYAYTKTDRTFKDAFGTYPYDGRFNHAEVFLNRDFSDHVQVLTGVNGQYFQMMDENASVKNPKTNLLSPYFSIFFKKLGVFSAEIGGRYNHHSVYGNTFTYSLNPSFLIQDRIKLFANYSTGFKAPTLTQLYGQFGANENLNLEESQSLEGGVQLLLPQKKLDIRATVFSREIDNAIAYTTGYINLNTLNDYGVEVELTAGLNDKISLTGNYAYVDGEITTQTTQGAETLPNELIRRPKHAMGLGLTYQATPAWFVGLNFQNFGKRNDLFFDLNDFSNKAVVLDAYQLLNLYSQYKIMKGKLNLFVDARNLLNEEYVESEGYNTQGFNLTCGVTFNF